jgi:hypothetical protein
MPPTLFSASFATHSSAFDDSCTPLLDILPDALPPQWKAQANLSNSLQPMPHEVILMDLASWHKILIKHLITTTTAPLMLGCASDFRIPFTAHGEIRACSSKIFRNLTLTAGLQQPLNPIN